MKKIHQSFGLLFIWILTSKKIAFFFPLYPNFVELSVFWVNGIKTDYLFKGVLWNWIFRHGQVPIGKNKVTSRSGSQVTRQDPILLKLSRWFGKRRVPWFSLIPPRDGPLTPPWIGRHARAPGGRGGCICSRNQKERKTRCQRRQVPRHTAPSHRVPEKSHMTLTYS